MGNGDRLPRNPAAGTTVTAAFAIDLAPPWLIARFREPQRMLSWAVARPGHQVGDRVAWLEVANAELSVDVDPAALLAERMRGHGLAGAIGLMTSTPLATYQLATATRDGVAATCLMTLGLGNAERIGQRRSNAVGVGEAAPAVGTINALCHVSVPLTEPAMLEALCIATEARTTAILERGYEAAPGSGAVTGTGTDCIVMACPMTGVDRPFAGLHTAIGEALGSAVLTATARAMDDWLSRNGRAASPRRKETPCRPAASSA